MRTKCPICGGNLVSAGQVQVKNPNTDRKKLVAVVRCKNKKCGWRTIT